MTNTKLLVRLRDMHEELSGINLDLGAGELVDEATIDALGQLVTDLSRLVDQAKADTAQEKLAIEQNGLASRILEFENQHPRVRQFLTQMTDLLAMVGI